MYLAYFTRPMRNIAIHFTTVQLTIIQCRIFVLIRDECFVRGTKASESLPSAAAIFSVLRIVGIHSRSNLGPVVLGLITIISFTV
jgi:hypothetical protein